MGNSLLAGLLATGSKPWAWLLLGLVAVAGAAVLAPYRFTLGMPAAPNETTVDAGRGFQTRISYWPPRGIAEEAKSPAVLFLHGSGGMLHPSYGLLCDKLSAEGVFVAAPWLRGYPGGARVEGEFDAARWDPAPDIAAAYAWLRANPRVDARRIAVAGHSLGAGYALRFGLAESTVAAIVSLSRLDMESRLRSWPGYYPDARHAFSRTFGFPDTIAADAFDAFAESQIFVFERFKPALQRADHPRVLFAVGGRERESDKRWLREYAAAAKGSARYVEFREATHAMSTRPLPAGLVAYDRRVIPEMAPAIAAWVRDPALAGVTR